MLAILFLTLVVLVGFFMWKFGSYSVEDIGEFFFFGGIIFLGITLIVLPFVLMGCQDEINQFNVLRETIGTARENPNISQFELAALQQKVIDANQWLVSSKYWQKNPITSWFVLSKVQQLEVIK